MRVLNFGERRYLHCIYQDITETRKAAIALERANRALRTLSAANEELVRATSERELLTSVCRAIVEIGGFSAASVGYAQNDPEKSIMPMAWAGMNESYISGHIQTWADSELGQRPISKTMRSGKPEVVRNILADPGFAHWKDDAIKSGFVSNIALPLSNGARTIGALNIYASEPDAFDSDEIHLLVELASDLSYGIATLRTRAERDRIAHAHAHHEETLRKSLEDSIQAIAATVEMRDPYTAGHERRVGDLAAAIAREMGLADDRIHGIRLAASIHDLGKINVPAEILAKPGKLTNIEYLLIKTHAQAGYEILKDIEFPWPIAAIVWQHHERLDGSGYPQGLKDGEILLEARIMAVADVVEAMASHRPYRPSLGIEAALAEIERGRAAAAYDPAAVDACLRLFREGRFAFAI
ncbi:MAG: GAF domain-containing protein [Betaproteobacteria bacterium]|nr:GAF domain-containing protein [Betaproteobacteria bacterium]